MPNSLQSSAIASPASRRATNCSLSSITEHSFQGITPSPLRGESVTYVSGTMCYLCLRPLIRSRLHLGSSLHSGSDPSLTAESMFEIFVNNSSEEVLKKKEADHLGYIRYACTMHGANHDEIKPDAVKAACAGRAPTL